MSLTIPSGILYFDVDKTLFDTSRYMNELVFPALAAKLTIDLEAVSQWGRLFRHTLPKPTAFTPEAFSEWLGRELRVSADTIAESFYQPTFFRQALFPETITVLERLANSYHLGIYSEGVEKWQQTKIDQSGIKGFFEQNEVIVSQDKLAPEIKAKLKPKSVVVDDSLPVITELVATGTLQPIWLDRAQTGAAPSEATRITSLTELVDLVK